MNKLFKHIYKDYQEFTISFLKWYNTKNYDVDVKDIVKIQSIFVLSILHEYIIEKYNLFINFDIGCIVISYYNPELNVNDIIALSKDNNKFTYTVYKEFDMKPLGYIESYARAILKTIEYINEPF